jgi:outer membrane lipoprotein-sorting protein
MRPAWMAALAAAAVLAVSSAQAKMTAEDVVAQIEKNYNAIRDYRADVEVTINSPQVHMPKLKATIYFKRPNKIKLIAKEGFAVLPKDAVSGDPARWMKTNFKMSYLGSGRVAGEPVHVLRLVPKTTEVQGTTKLLVEKRRGLILGTETEAGGASFRSRWTYTRVDGKYWLPSEIRTEMSGAMSTRIFDPDKMKVAPPKAGKGTALVRFSNYTVNRGIPDSVFEYRKGAR